VKKSAKFIFVVILVLAVLVAGRNIIVKFAVEKGVQTATGLPLQIKDLDLGLTTTHIGIKDLNLFNPKGFPKEVMFHASEIFVDYNLGAMIKGKIHLEDIRLDFDQFVIVKNKEGQTNIETLKPKEEASKKRGEEKSKEKKKAPDIQIDHLLVKVGKVVYKDYSQEGEPSVKEFKVNISEEMRDVNSDNMNWLIMLVAQKAIMKTALGSLVDFNVDVVKDAIAVPKEAVGALKDTAETTLKSTAETLKGTAETLKKKIKLPFGGGK